MNYNKKIKVNNINTLSTYTPIRSKDYRKDIDWDGVVGIFLSDICEKLIDLDNLDAFEEKCEEAFTDKFNKKEFWLIIKKMYFESKDLFKISPDFLMLKSKASKQQVHNERISYMFTSILGEKINLDFNSIKLNFLEQELNTILKKYLIQKDCKKKKMEDPYLPFITENFINDLLFLKNYSKYFIDNIKNLIKLYGFLYTSQLALNLRDFFEEPENKQLYFILENEKASGERCDIRNNGYALFSRRIKKVFPLLSISQQLQESFDEIKPFWKFCKELEDNFENREYLLLFLEEFTVSRNFVYTGSSDKDNIYTILKDIRKIAEQQFSKDYPVENRSKIEVNEKIVNGYLKRLCKDFIQYRGAAGATLVITHEVFLLLTNISIGNNKKMRLNELLKEMEKRGVYFDKKSIGEIIKLYERIGNVERMSDSGDAIYVKKTI